MDLTHNNPITKKPGWQDPAKARYYIAARDMIIHMPPGVEDPANPRMSSATRLFQGEQANDKAERQIAAFKRIANGNGLNWELIDLSQATLPTNECDSREKYRANTLRVIKTAIPEDRITLTAMIDPSARERIKKTLNDEYGRAVKFRDSHLRNI